MPPITGDTAGNQHSFSKHSLADTITGLGGKIETQKGTENMATGHQEFMVWREKAMQG